MKAAVLRVMLACSAALTSQGLVAQNSAELTLEQIDTERQKITAERQRHEAAFTQIEKACQDRFAVSDCLLETRAQRRIVMAELRRQEVALNDTERQRKALATIQKIQEKMADKQSSEKKGQPQQSIGAP